jgi:hypothetical protein
MVAIHPFHLIDNTGYRVVNRTPGFAVQYSHWFAATFINSWNERSFVAAVERYWVTGEWGFLDFGVGYRAGVITGYDERTLELARHTPVVPFVGPLAWTHVGPIGVNLFYTYRAMSLEGSLRY